MTRTKKLATVFAGVLAVAPLLGTSAFAETRHRDATENGRGTWRQNQSRQDQRNHGRNWQQQQRQQARPPVQQYGNRANWGGENRAYRNNGDRNESYRGYRNDNTDRGGERQEFRGRVSRIEHDRGGYRVWVGGGAYPIFIPEARWRLWPLRVGLSIGIGGYWDSLGYYNAYDYSGPYYSSGDLHGIMESVDYRRGTAVLRDDVSGSFVTIELRGGDPRLGDLRPGDSVDLSGAWDRAGFFEAYTVLNLQSRY